MTAKGGVFLRPYERHFYCPQCGQTAVRFDNIANAPPGAVVSEFHNCRALRGAYVPMVDEGVKAKIALVDREDYVGDECVQRDASGRVLMAAETTRDEGTDRTVYAPCVMMGRDSSVAQRLRELARDVDAEPLPPRVRALVDAALGKD